MVVGRVAALLGLALASPAVAAGGGGGAGGSGAQNAINSGRTVADGHPGPVGSPNNPRSAPQAVRGEDARVPGTDQKR